MGMNAVCSKGCGYSAPSDNHRGGSLGSCPDCGAPMQAATAGKADGRYLCPVTRRIVTLGLDRRPAHRADAGPVETWLPEDRQGLGVLSHDVGYAMRITRAAVRRLEKYAAMTVTCLA